MRPATGLDAAARLLCLGAHVTVRPLPSDLPWPGDLVAYRSGAIRSARSLQTVLAPIGLETRLDDLRGDLEVWIR